MIRWHTHCKDTELQVQAIRQRFTLLCHTESPPPTVSSSLALTGSPSIDRWGAGAPRPCDLPAVVACCVCQRQETAAQHACTPARYPVPTISASPRTPLARDVKCVGMAVMRVGHRYPYIALGRVIMSLMLLPFTIFFLPILIPYWIFRWALRWAWFFCVTLPLLPITWPFKVLHMVI
ncbi:MAG: hypothetical protein WDW38_010950 [Sanguina aurantia]